MTRRTRLRILYGMVATTLALVLSVWLVVRTIWFRDWLRDQAVSRVNETINGTLAIDTLEGGLFSGVRLKGVTLSDAGTPILEAETIEAGYDALDLVLGNIRIEHLTVRRPRLHLIGDDRGWNINRALATDSDRSTSESTSVTIGRIVIEDARVDVAVDQSLMVDLSQTSLEAAVSVEGDRTTIDIHRGTAFDERSDTAVDILSARLTLDTSGVLAEHIDVRAPTFAITGEARVADGTTDTSVDLRLTLDRFAASTYAVYLPPSVPALSPMSGEVTARGPLSAVDAEWSLTMGDSALSGAVWADVVAAMPVVRGRVTVRDLDPALIAGNDELAGRVSGSVVIDGAIDRAEPLRSRGTVSMSAGVSEVMGYRVDSLDAEGEMADGVLEVSGSATAHGARIRTRASLANLGDGQTPTLAASGRVDRVDVSRFPEATGRPDLETDVQGAYTVQLTGETWNIRFEAGESTIANATISSGAIVTAAGRGKAVDATLSAGIGNLSSNLLPEPPEHVSTVAGHVQASVSLPDVEAPDLVDSASGSIEVVLDKSTVFGTAVTNADVRASLAAGLVTVERLEIAADAATVHAAGVLAVGRSAGADSNLDFEANVSDLSMLPADLVTGLRGGATIAGTVAGPSDRPSAAGTIHLRQPGYQDTVEALAVNGTFDVSLPDRDPERLMAEVALDSTFLNVADQQLQRVEAQATYGSDRLDITAEVDQEARSLEIDGGVAFYPGYRQVELRNLTIAGSGAAWRLESDGAAPTTMRYGQDAVDIKSMALVRGSERVEISGVVGLPDRPASTDVALKVTAVNLGELLTMVLGDAVVSGTIDGSVQVTGDITSPHADASVTVADGAVRDVPFTAARADVSVADRMAVVKAYVDEGSGARFDVVGTVPVGGGEAAPLDVRVTSSGVSLGLLAGVTSHLAEVEGSAAVDLHLGGTLSDLVIEGVATVDGGSFLVTPTGVRYRNVAMDTRFDGNRVVVDHASVEDEDGRLLSMTGGGTLLGDSAARAVAIDVMAEDFRVLDNELGEVALTVDARVEGALSSPDLTGRVTVDRGRIEVDELLPMLGLGTPADVVPPPADAVPASAAASAEAAASSPAEAEQASAAGQVAAGGPLAAGLIDVEVVLPDNVVLRGRNIRTSTGSLGLGDMNLTVGGTVAARKAADEPLRVVGSVGVIRGFYEFQGRRFDVEEGSELRFRGGDSLNPALDVSATRDVSGVIARVQVSGTADQPRIVLSSDPPLDEGDVLSLIVFNQPVSQLGESEQVDLLDRAGDMALGALATSLADSIGGALNVDLFEIRAPSAGDSGNVTLGSQLNDRLFVGFRQDFGSSGASRLSFEYRLSEFLRLLTSVGQGSDQGSETRDRESAGVDLLFRYRY